MAQLAIFFILPCIIIVSGFIRSNDVNFDGNDLDLTGLKVREKIVEDEEKRTLWVIRINNEDINDLRLELATKREEEDFEEVVQPIILALLLQGRQHLITNVKLPKSDPDVKGDQDLKGEILRIVNKFVLSTSNEPDIYLPDSGENDSCVLTVNFKGPFTSLVISFGRKQWYFNILPSPFPQWFYDEHKDVKNDKEEKYIFVPDEVVHGFYRALLYTIKRLLSYPL